MRKQREDKLKEQKLYKEILDKQIKFSKDNKIYGNMTQVEK